MSGKRCPYSVGQTGKYDGQRWVVVYIGTIPEEERWGTFRILKLNPRNPDHANAELSYALSALPGIGQFTPDDPDTADAVKGEMGAVRTIADLRARLAAAESLAYIGESRFPDLTWKARCEEATQDARDAKAKLAAAEKERDDARDQLTRQESFMSAERAQIPTLCKRAEVAEAKLAAAERQASENLSLVNVAIARAEVAEAEVSRLAAELHIYHTALPEYVPAETHRDAKDARAHGPYPVDPVDWEGEAKGLRDALTWARKMLRTIEEAVYAGDEAQAGEALAVAARGILRRRPGASGRRWG